MTTTKRRLTTLVIGTVIAIIATLGGIAAYGRAGAQTSSRHTDAASVATAAMRGQLPRNGAQAHLYIAMRLLWAQHMEWTYATVAAFADGSPSLQPTLDRLLRNQSDIGNAVKPFYGRAAGNQLTALLMTHIKDAVPVLVAAKAGDTKALTKAVADWYANAKQIGDFLAAANPYWCKKAMESTMRTHITQTIAYASDQLKGNYAKSIIDYGKAEAHMMQMSDMLSRGLVLQFPVRFWR